MKKLLLMICLLPFTLFGQGTYDVTFRVDMNLYTGTPFNAVEVLGDFNNFAGGVTILADGNGDGVWEATVSINADSIEYVFAVDTGTNNYIAESLMPTMPCTKTVNPPFTNRFDLLSSDTTLPEVCWESCVDCGGTPLTSNVTFRVDMSEYSGTAFSQVHLNGNFNGFCGSCAEMTDPDGDDIYEITVSLTSGDTAEYIYALDGFNTGAEDFPVGAFCTKTTFSPPDTFTNRILVPMGDSILPANCYNSCTPCGISGFVKGAEFASLDIYPNPSQGVFNVSGDFENNEDLSIHVIDIRGREVMSLNTRANSFNNQIDLTRFENGVYFIQIISGNDIYSESVLLSK